MKVERSESINSRASFTCGAVLGICLGFALGHFLVWSRAVKRTPDEAGWAWVSDGAHRAPSHGGTIRTSEIPIEHPDMTAALEPFFGSAARRRGVAPPVDVSAGRSPVRVATDLSPGGITPDPLPEGVRAAPIDEQTRFQEQVTRTIIAQELPQATPAEQEVWFDVLRGLDAADVKGILRMRKHVGAGPEGMASAPGRFRDPLAPIPDFTLPAERPVPSAWKDTIQCLQQVREIRLHNLCNRDTVGFMKLDPQLSEVSEGNARGIRLSHVQRAFDHGEFFETSRVLDVAIDGPGFFQVGNGNELRLTRNGRFVIDEERHLALGTTDQPWRLDPPIVIPEKTTSLEIHRDGRVTAASPGATADVELGRILLVNVLDPTGLQYHGEGLFAVTTASGSSFACNSSLKQFMVERPSRATMELELIALEREERLLQDLTPPAHNQEPAN